MKIDGYSFDVYLREETALRNEVTRYPVEEGTDYSDHIITRPATVTIEGLVSDTPLNPSTSTGLPSNDAYAHLAKIMSDKRLVTITTTRRRYENMALVSLSDPRDINTGEALRFTATFEQVLTVSVSIKDRTTVVELPREQKKGRKKAKPPEEVEPPKPAVAETRGSTLSKITKWATQ